MQKKRIIPGFQCLNVFCSRSLSIEVHSPLIGGARVRGAWHALASVVMVAGWSVVFSPCSTSVCLCAALTSCSLSVFFPFPSYPPLCVSIPPSLLQHSPNSPSPFSLPSSSAPRLLSQILPISFLRLGELRFSPDINVWVFLSWALRFARWE